MNKLISLIKTESFWWWLIGSGLAWLALETFIWGRWALPLIGYRAPYMGAITSLDVAFAIGFAILFGIVVAMLVLARRVAVASCAIGSGSGLLALFTLLCPICPVFLLSLFGTAATVTALTPYFWWLRLVAGLLLLVSGWLAWQRLGTLTPSGWSLQRFGYRVTIIAIGVLLVINQTLAIQIGHTMVAGHSGDGMMLTGQFAQDVAALVTPTMLPAYAQELGLDMSNISAINESIRKLGIMAPMQGSNPIALDAEQMKRYIAIGTEPYITCEFCCGVKTLVREDGAPTCACAHSIAMRGTAAYLIANHPEMTNADIAYELMRQKGLYFPTQMQERMATSLAGSVDDFTPDIKYLTKNLSATELADLQRQATSSGFTPQTAAPSMVGGC